MWFSVDNVFIFVAVGFSNFYDGNDGEKVVYSVLLGIFIGLRWIYHGFNVFKLYLTR